MKHPFQSILSPAREQQSNIAPSATQRALNSFISDGAGENNVLNFPLKPPFLGPSELSAGLDRIAAAAPTAESDQNDKNISPLPVTSGSNLAISLQDAASATATPSRTTQRRPLKGGTYDE